MNYLNCILSPSFFYFLLQLEATIIESTKSSGCIHCKGRLHRSDWRRAGFGLPHGCKEAVLKRASFLCSKCRKRTTPNSLIWMYYRHYASPTQFLIPALEQKIPKKQMADVAKKLGVTADLLRLWKKWWKSKFTRSIFFRGCQGLGMNCQNAPEGLLSWFKKGCLDPKEILTRVSRFLAGYRTDRLHTLFPEAVERLQALSSAS